MEIRNDHRRRAGDSKESRFDRTPGEHRLDRGSVFLDVRGVRREIRNREKGDELVQNRFLVGDAIVVDRTQHEQQSKSLHD
jgi:hypothetical protein